MTDRTLAIARLLVAFIVDVAAIYGYTLPVGEEMLYPICALVVMLVTHVWVWWKNNNVTDEASKAQILLDAMKADDPEVIKAVGDIIQAIHEEGLEDADA